MSCSSLAAVGVVTWAGATARWWTLVLLSVLAATIASSLVLTVVGIVAVAAATWIGTRQRDLPVARAAAGRRVGLNIAIRSEVGGFLGLSALLTIVRRDDRAGVRLSPASRRCPPLGGDRIDHRSAVLAVMARARRRGGGGGAGGELRDGAQLARDGISLLDDGDYLAAAEQFEQAADAFASSDERWTGVWGRPAAWLPVVAQHRSAALDLSSSAAVASADLADALQVVDPEQLRLVNGRFDLDAIRLIEQPFMAVQSSIPDLRDAIAVRLTVAASRRSAIDWTTSTPTWSRTRPGRTTR